MGKWWDLHRAELPDEADLAKSTNTPDRYRGFFRGEGGIEGHAEFAKVDARDLVLISVAAGIALGVLGSVVVVNNRERIKRWWEDRVITTAQSSWNRITQRAAGNSQSATVEVTVLNRPAHDKFSREIDVAIDDIRTRMSTSEAQRYLFAVLLAASFIAEAMRKLSNARIEGGLPELSSAMKKLTTERLTDTMNRMLATSPSLLDDKTSAVFMRIFGGGQVVDGEYVPLRLERVKEALSLAGHRSTDGHG